MKAGSEDKLCPWRGVNGCTDVHEVSQGIGPGVIRF